MLSTILADAGAAQGLTGPQAAQAVYVTISTTSYRYIFTRSFENKRLQERQKIADAAIAAGAFGGGREGVQRGVYDAETAA